MYVQICTYVHNGGVTVTAGSGSGHRQQRYSSARNCLTVDSEVLPRAVYIVGICNLTWHDWGDCVLVTGVSSVSSSRRDTYHVLHVDGLIRKFRLGIERVPGASYLAEMDRQVSLAFEEQHVRGFRHHQRHPCPSGNYLPDVSLTIVQE